MENSADLVVSCDDKDRIIGTVNRLLPRLDRDLRDKLDDIKAAMIQHGGKEGMFICLNGKSVAAIITEYEHVFRLEPIAGGERDGVSFRLFAAPKTRITIDELGRVTSSPVQKLSDSDAAT